MAKKQQPENNSQQEGKSKINVNELLENLDKQKYGKGNERRLIEEAQNFIYFIKSEIPDEEQQTRILNNIEGIITELEGESAVGGYDRAIQRIRSNFKKDIKRAITEYTQYKNNQESAVPADEIAMVAEKADKNDEVIMKENASIKQFLERSADGDQNVLSQGREILSEAAEKAKTALDEFKDILKSIIDDNKDIAIEYFNDLTKEERAKVLSHLSGKMGALAKKLEQSGVDKGVNPQYKKIKKLYQNIKESDRKKDVKDDQGTESSMAGEAPKQETEQTNQATEQVKKEEQVPKIKINKDGVISNGLNNAADKQQIIERKKITNEKTQLSLYYKVRDEIQELLAKLPDEAKKEEYKTRYQEAQKSTGTLSGMRKANQQFQQLKQDLLSLISTVSVPDISMKASPEAAEVGEIKEDFQAEFEEYKEYSGEQKRIYLENLLRRIKNSDNDDAVLRGEIEDELARIKLAAAGRTTLSAEQREEKLKAFKSEYLALLDEEESLKSRTGKEASARTGEIIEEEKRTIESALKSRLGLSDDDCQRTINEWVYDRISGAASAEAAPEPGEAAETIITDEEWDEAFRRSEAVEIERNAVLEDEKLRIELYGGDARYEKLLDNYKQLVALEKEQANFVQQNRQPENPVKYAAWDRNRIEAISETINAIDRLCNGAGEIALDQQEIEYLKELMNQDLKLEITDQDNQTVMLDKIAVAIKHRNQAVCGNNIGKAGNWEKKINELQEKYKEKYGEVDFSKLYIDNFEKIREKFASEFDVKNEDLEKLGFYDLTEGQRLLVLRNLQQMTLGRIHEEALSTSYIKGYNKREKGKLREYAKENTKIFLGNVWRGVSKKYQIAKTEKMKAEEIAKGGYEMHGEVLRQLINGLKAYGPEVEIRNGKLEIQFATGLGEQFKLQEAEFNRVANELCNIPYEWSLPTADEKEREKYETAKQEYEEAQKEILNILKGQEGEQNACLIVNKIEGQIRINQFLNSHPEVEEQLQKIKDEKLWRRALEGTLRERGLYCAGGYVTRVITANTLSLIGAPLVLTGVGLGGVVVGMGGWIARKRGKENLKEREILARKGKKDKSKEAKNFVGAEQLHKKLVLLMNEIESASDEEERKKLLGSLKARIKYTEGKIEDGLVNFGNYENRLANQYYLTNILQEAEITSKINQAGERKKLEERLERFLEFKQEKISKAQKSYLNKQTIKGAVLAGAFFGAGYAFRHYASEHFGWGGKQPKPLDLRNQKLKSELAELHTKEMEELQKPRFIKDEEAQQRFQDEIKRIADEQSAREAGSASEQGGAETGATEAPGAGKVLEQQKDDLLKLATIKKGEGIEHAIRRQLEADPQAHGFKGDINDHAAVHKWSGGEAHRDAIKAGYVDAKTGEQIMVGAKGRDNAAYVLEKNAQGNEQVAEYLKGKDGKFGVQETHELAKDFKSAKFEGADKDAYEYIGRHQAEKTGVAEAARGPRGAEDIGASADENIASAQAEGSYEIDDKTMDGYFGQKFSYEAQNRNGELFALLKNQQGEIIENIEPINITGKNPGEATELVKSEIWDWSYNEKSKMEALGFDVNTADRIKEIKAAGIDPFDRGGLDKADIAKLEFWKNHSQFEATEIKRMFEISEQANIGYNQENFVQTFEKMPATIKESDAKSLGYMKVFASPDGALEAKKEGLKALLGLDAAPEIEIKGDGKMIIVKDVFRMRGFNLLITENKIGVDGPGRWNWGISGLLRWIKPANTLSAENLDIVKAETIRMFRGFNKISQ